MPSLSALVAALGLTLALGLGLTPPAPKRWLPDMTEDEARAVVTSFSFGCMYAKLVIDMALCGLFTVQLISYFKYVRHERRWILGVVVVSSLLTYAISGFIVFYVHHLFVAGWGSWMPFLETNYYCMYPAFDAVASSTAQGFFTYRAWRLLGRDWRIVAVLVTLIGASLVCACVVTGLLWHLDSIREMERIKGSVITWLTCVMLADVVITAGIGYGLLRSRTGWAHTDKVPATIMAMSFLIVFIIKPASLLNFVWQGIQSKFYLIELLYTLNARVSFEVRRVSVFRKRDLGGITVDVETETFAERGSVRGRARGGRAGLRSSDEPAENEIIPLERFESVPYARYGSSTSVGRRSSGGTQGKDEREGEEGVGDSTDTTDETVVGEVMYKQRDWE